MLDQTINWENLLQWGGAEAVGGREQLRGVSARIRVDQHGAQSLWRVASVLDKAAGLILQMLPVSVWPREGISNVVGGKGKPQVYALKYALCPVLPSPCSCCYPISVSVLCRGEFQVSPGPVPPGDPRTPRVPLHHPSAAGRPHIPVLHLCDVLSGCCSAAGKPQTLIQKESIR